MTAPLPPGRYRVLERNTASPGRLTYVCRGCNAQVYVLRPVPPVSRHEHRIFETCPVCARRFQYRPELAQADAQAPAQG